MSPLPLFKWFEATALGTLVRKSNYLFPTIEVLHLFGLTILLGTVLAMNLRLLGLGMRRQPSAEVARSFAPLFWTGFATTILSGVVLFLAEAMKCYYNEAFLYKMILLALALAFHLSLHRKVRLADAPNPLAAKTVALLSLTLWFGVGVAGRFIGFI